MHVTIRREPEEAIAEAAELLLRWIQEAPVRDLMVAGGNTPLPLYAAVAQHRRDAPHLRIHVLDEYVGVPNLHPRSCTNLLRTTVAEGWRIRPENFFGLNSEEASAEAAVIEHEQRIDGAGGLDAIVLGLGKNGHLGFNEPGSLPDSRARVLDLDPLSIKANREWFGGEYAPARGATVGLRTILSARRTLLLAFGAAKADAVHAMLGGPRSSACPASFLQGRPEVHVFLDDLSASRIV